MEEQNHFSFYKFIQTQALLVTKLVRDVATLANYEWQLARKSFVWIFVLSLLAFSLCISLFSCIDVFIYFYLISNNISTLLALAYLAGGNLLLLLFVCVFIIKMKKNFLFPATLRQFKKVGYGKPETNDENSAAKN